MKDYILAVLVKPVMFYVLYFIYLKFVSESCLVFIGRFTVDS